jgi:DNA helicase-2/ATP-dependent DNA helicase PcrA
MLLEAKAELVPPRPSPERPYQPGARVFHQKFGYGRVVGVEAGKLDIEFEHAGRKKVMDSFVEPA